MNESQLKVLNDVPALYRTTFERAFDGKSKSAGIKGFCLACVGYLRNDVRDCSSFVCPLHPHRPYQKKKSKKIPAITGVLAEKEC